MRRKCIRILHLALITFCLLAWSFAGAYANEWSGNISEGFDSGSGLESDPYVIKTPDQLAYLAKCVNDGNNFKNKYFVLESDIKLNDESFVFDGDTGLVRVSDGTNVAYLGTGIPGDATKGNTVFDSVASEMGKWYKNNTSKEAGAYLGALNEWTAIGKENKRFEGYFDGKDHKISSLFINTEASYGGLFGDCKATIINLKIENSFVKAAEFCGVVAGKNLGNTENCMTQAIVCSSQNYSGGVVGRGDTVRRCMADVTVTGTQNVGGVAGFAKAYECCSTGYVFGTQSVGGIIGEGYGADDLNYSSVSGQTNVGGICGYFKSSSSTLETSFNVGSVVGENYVGSVIGRLVTGSAKNCYYLKDSAKDLAETIQFGVGAENSGETKKDRSGATTALDEDQAKLEDSFFGFDFEYVWTISENEMPGLVKVKPQVHTHTYDNDCDPDCNICQKAREVSHKYSTEYAKNEDEHWYACACGDKKSIEKHVFDDACDTVCNLCRHVRIVSHSYPSTLSKDSENHWYECTVCHNKKDVQKHEPGKAATESTPQTCIDCAYVIVAALGHTHNYSDTWNHDTNSHWHECSCTDQKDLASHVYDNACDTDCNVCKYTRITDHSFEASWSSDKDSHWHECSICHAQKDKAAHTEGAPATESDPQVCTLCGYVIKAPLAHTHKYSNSWSSDGQSHWHSCPCGDKKDIAAHSFDNACDTTCNECGFVRIISHNYSQTWSTNQTQHWHECACGDKKEVANHVFDNLCDTDCNTCAYVRNITHSYQTTLSNDQSSHWYECAVCHDKKDMEAHIAGAPATESEPQKCTACGFVIKAALGHTHSYSENMNHDQSKHWYECVCGNKKDSAKHVFDNSCDTGCNICSYVRDITHNYKTTLSSDQSSHWYECAVCHDKKDMEAHIAGAPATESEPQKCTACGFVIKAALGHTHSYLDAWSSNKTSHWHECECGDKKDKSDHTFDNDCDILCNVCGYERTIKHDYSVENHDDKSHWLECSVCGVTQATQIHVFDNMCDTNCNECSYERNIKHVYSDIFKNDENGHWKECALCTAQSEKTSHTFDEGVVTKEPTQTQQGTKIYKCTVCKLERSQTLDKLPATDTTPANTTAGDTSSTPDTQSTTSSTTTQAPPTNAANANDDLKNDQSTEQKTDGFLILAVVLGCVCAVLLVVLIVMMMYYFKKRE